MADVTERKTNKDLAFFTEYIDSRYKGAKNITSMMDNLNTHKPDSLNETSPPENVKTI